MNTVSQNQRLVIAHNPHSSRSSLVQQRVFDRLDAAGYDYKTIEVKQASLGDNITWLAPQIRANDIILSAAGDGSAHAVFHAVMAANQHGVQLGFLAYGNFNDVPHTFTGKTSLRDPIMFLEQAKPETIFPLSVFVNDKPLRSALLYVTVGWTARAASQFDNPRVRSKLTRGGAGLAKSLMRLSLYYFKSRRLSVLPAFRYKGVLINNRTDLLFANGPTVARLFRTGKRYYRQDVFLFRMLDVRRLIANAPFLTTGLISRMKGEETTGIEIKFQSPAEVPVQCDGEVVELKDAIRIEVKKADEPLTVLVTK